MKKWEKLLKEKKYKRIKFSLLESQHLLIKARINGVKGYFILDTGASNTCVGTDKVTRFQLDTQHSKNKTAGVGSTNMDTLLAKNASIALGKWKIRRLNLVVFDMMHVNEALQPFCKKTVSGIIGADILLKGKAIIDYKNKHLYLKK